MFTKAFISAKGGNPFDNLYFQRSPAGCMKMYFGSAFATFSNRSHFAEFRECTADVAEVGIHKGETTAGAKYQQALCRAPSESRAPVQFRYCFPGVPVRNCIERLLDVALSIPRLQASLHI